MLREPQKGQPFPFGSVSLNIEGQDGTAGAPMWFEWSGTRQNAIMSMFD